MSLNENDCLHCTTTGLDLFSSPPIQTAVEMGQWVEFYPLATITQGGPIEFMIKGNSEDYLDLTNSYIHLQAKVVQPDGTDLVAEDDSSVAPENLFLHALFSEVDVSLNGVLISNSTNTYSYRAYLETLLSYGTDAKNSQLANAMFYKSGPSIFTLKPETKDNKDLQIRQKRINRSQTIDMVGRLHADLFSQNKFLMNGVDLSLRFIRSKSSFALLACPIAGGEKAKDYRINITSMSLFIRKMKLNPGILLAHAKALEKCPARYPIKRVTTKVFSVPKGNMNVVEENIFLSQRPNKLIIGLTSSVGFNGSLQKSCFEFSHFDINSLALYLSGYQIPTKAFRPDFENGTWARSYFSLFQGTNTGFDDFGNSISYEDYANGYSLFCFDLTPSVVDGAAVEMPRVGSLRLEIGFKKPLPEPIHIICLGESDGMIQIDKARQVLTDF